MKKNTLHKVMATALVGAMAMSTLTGCGSNADNTTADAGTKESVAESPAASTDAGTSTAVAGIALTSLTSDSGIVGSFFAGFGIKIAYTRIGITVAMIFVGIPFVVRSVQPVLEKMDNSYSEAAGVLGAKKTTIFWKVIFPELKPAIFAGTGLAFGRCLGEYGSVVFIAGNKPYYTEITPLVIMSELQEFDYSSATAIALVMLAVSFFILFLNSMIQQRNARILRGGNA